MDHAGDTNPARFSQYFKPRGKCTPRVQLFEATSHARRLTSPPPGRAGQTFDATVGLDPEDGQPRELFLSGGKSGSMLDALLGDVAVVVSVALQYGITPAALAKSLARVPASRLVPTDPATLSGQAHTAPASVIGAALNLLREFEASGT